MSRKTERRHIEIKNSNRTRLGKYYITREDGY